VDEQGRVAAVVDDELRSLAALVRQSLVGAPPVVFQRLAFQAKTGTPVAAMAAAAWSCVEKMLQLASGLPRRG